MSTGLIERSRIFMMNWVFATMGGMTMAEWLGLLRKHRFAVDPQYVPRAALMTLYCGLTTGFAQYEEHVYGPQVRQVAVKAPVFILGHWRSGTTMLHNLMSIDQRFASPTVWQVLNPRTFLTTERWSDVVNLVSPKTRVMDNVKLGMETPFEDEFATIGTLRSPFLRWVFPRTADYYDRYLTFAGVPQQEIDEWKAALRHFYQKLTWKYQRPLLLKSPPHTCRIKLLLELFPDARFIHISRNPYAIFRSTKKQIEYSFSTTCLQNWRPLQADAWIIERYKAMYDAFFAERDLIPAGQFHEVRFEDVTRDPLGELRQIYQAVGLPDFAAVEPALQGYISSLGHYRNNEHSELPTALRNNIAQAWRQSFETWGYAC